jgi:hypothetical protein
VFGYLLDPIAIYKKAVEDGTFIDSNRPSHCQFSTAVTTYHIRLARHCGIKYNDIITIRNPDRDMPAADCIVAASNLSKRSRIPRMDIIEKAKEFLGTMEEPKWYYVVKT